VPDGIVVARIQVGMPPTPGDSVIPESQIPRFEYEPGAVIGQRYRLEAPIGFGGMGTVWRAHNQILDAPLALKLLRPNVNRSGLSERLLLEAKVAACLCHPAIVRVYDFGMTEQGDPFLAMELLQGESIRELLDRERSLVASQAVRLVLPILAGLMCAHARGIVHRDLKPDNIFLARDDAGSVEPKLVDFGIAKFEGTSSRLTTAGVLLGSPSYMSPEQSMGNEDIDMRADIWAISVVLYEAIAGRPPWEASNCPARLRAIVDDPPPSLQGIGGVDAELWAVIERGLAKSREDRWSSSRDLGRALAAWLDRRGVVDDLTGTSLNSAWLADQPSGNARGLLESVPAIFTSPTVEKAEQASELTQDECPRQSAVTLPRGRRRKLTFAVGVPLAASLVLFQVGFHSPRSPTPISAPMRQTDSPASFATVAVSGSGDPATVASSCASARPRAAESTSRGTIKPLPASSVGTPAAKAPPPKPGSARAMDFGF